MAITEIDRATGLNSSAAYKAPCALATTANITLAGEQTIDGTLTDESRVLVKDQTDATQNGIWITSTGEWQRAPDFSRNDQVADGTRVWVTGGTSGGGEYVLTTDDPVDLDTSDLVFELSSPTLAAQEVSAAIAAATDEAIADTAYLVARKADGSLIKRSWANIKTAITSGFLTIASAAATYLPLSAVATAAQYLANTASKVLTTDKTWAAADWVNLGATLTGSLAIDFSTFLNGYGTATGNITFDTHTNLKAQSGVFSITASGADRTVSFNTTNFATPNNASLGTITSGTTVDFSYYKGRAGKCVLTRLGTVA